jgi:hypothetical protein
MDRLAIGPQVANLPHIVLFSERSEAVPFLTVGADGEVVGAIADGSASGSGGVDTAGGRGVLFGVPGDGVTDLDMAFQAVLAPVKRRLRRAR